MAVATAIVVFLPPTGAFNVPTSGKVDLSKLARIVLVQFISEAVVDAFATSLEMKGGMSQLHARYWRNTSASTVLTQLLLVCAVIGVVLGCLVSL
jgi:hypothetical protein